VSRSDDDQGSPAPASEPLALGETLAALARDLGTPAPGAVRRLLEAWEELVGPAVARHAGVRSVRDGVLTVGVDGPAWATQLRYLERDLVDGIAERLGDPVVTSLRVVVEPPGTTGPRGAV